MKNVKTHLSDEINPKHYNLNLFNSWRTQVQLENIENLSGGLWINLKAETKDTKKKVAIFIGPETGTLNAEHVKECAKVFVIFVYSISF